MGNIIILKKVKVTMYKIYFLPIITYGAEFLSIVKKEWYRGQASEMRLLRI